MNNKTENTFREPIFTLLEGLLQFLKRDGALHAVVAFHLHSYNSKKKSCLKKYGTDSNVYEWQVQVTFEV